MNAPTLAAQWPKAKFTVAQIWALIEKGLVQPDAKFELLDGEVIAVSPKGPLHEAVRLQINDWFAGLPRHLAWLAETTLYLDDLSFLEPDYLVFDRKVSIRDLTPGKALLVIEVGNDSWRYDTNEKAARYAAHGVQEYWAIHAPSRMTRVHRGPSASGWADVRDVAAGEALAPLCAPELAFKLDPGSR